MKFYLLLILLTIFSSFSQKKTCSTPEESLEDFNSITKCSIEHIKSSNSKSKKNRQIKVNVSVSKKRFFKKRKNANSINPSGVSKTSKANLAKRSALILTKKISSVEMKKAKEFALVDEIPAFSKCKNTNGDKRTNCFNEELINHINKHFNYPPEAISKQIQGQVWIRFVIDKDGHIANMKAVAPKGGELLKEEALRVVSNLPDLQPATVNGKPVSVKYGFPLDFSLSE